MITLVLYLGILAFGLFSILRPDYILKRAGQKKNKVYEKKDYKVIRAFGVALILVFLVGMLSLVGSYAA